MLMMGGTKHRRYRVARAAVVRAVQGAVVDHELDRETVDALIDSIVDEGRAELNVDFCASIPVLTITGSFGVPVAEALDIRESLIEPGVTGRRARPNRRRPA